MLLRYRLAVVTAAGSGLGRVLAVALGRAGASVLAVDPDLAAAEETACLVTASRVRAWALQADVGDEDDLRLLAARAHDLGGAELMVVVAEPARPADLGCSALVASFVAGLSLRRGSREGNPGVVVVGDGALVPAGTDVAMDVGPARVMRVVLMGSPPPTLVARTVLDLLADGASGDVVTLPAPPGSPA